MVLFIYARPDHLRRTLACLRDNRVTLIYAFSDAPRSPDKAALVEQSREILRAIDWCDVRLIEREKNWGLGRSIMAGVTDVLNKHEACLVFEDDLICVPGTYDYLCAALRHYQDDPRVMSVTGWTHPLVTPRNVGTTPYFDGRAECWVWGTWARAWSGMNDRTALDMMLVAETRGIDRNHYGADLPQMAETEEERNIWAVRLLYHHIVQGGLCLRPPWSLVEHIGFDALATNASGPGQLANPPLRSCPPLPKAWPEPLENQDCAPLHRAATEPQPSLSPPFRIRVANRLKRDVRKLAFLVTGDERLKTVTMTDVARELAPPLAIRAVRAFRRRWGTLNSDSHHTDTKRHGLIGNYTTWKEAQADSGGYEAHIILRKTANALKKVKLGEAVYERDSVLFDQVQYSWPVLSGLMWAAAQTAGRLNVLDVGGSLGSSYYQNRAFLDGLDHVSWNVVEQPAHVELGRREFQDERLRFYQSIGACLSETQPNVILLSSVLQYLEDPYSLLDELRDTSCQFLILDRMPFWSGSTDHICVQHVPAEIYPASYPSWIFSTQRFMSILSLHWEVVAEFESFDRLPAPVEVSYRGLIAKRQG